MTERGVAADLDGSVLPELGLLRHRRAFADLDRRPRVGLVLGAGGVQGNAYLSGAVAALHQVTGWEPRTAALLIGTSAGSVHAALYGAGLPALFGLWRNRGGLLPADLDLAPAPPERAAADAGEGQTLKDIFSPALALPRLGPASPALAARTLLRPWAYRPEMMLTAWLPEGILTNSAIGTALQRIVPAGWVAHPRTWITAVNLRNGTRTVFGRPGAPRAHLDRAVRASCAIPGLYRPVRIGRERYVDGGMHSPSNADLAAELELDLVVVINPMSTLERVAATGIVDRYLSRLRHFAARRLAAELRVLAEQGVPTLVVQPAGRDLATFSRNLMDPRPRQAVAETAVETTTSALADPAVTAEVSMLRLAARSTGEDRHSQQPPGARA